MVSFVWSQADFGAKHAFGHVDKWTGLGLFFDSYDNEDSEAGALGLDHVKHPRILSIVNDGSFYWDHDAEGILEERRNGNGQAAAAAMLEAEAEAEAREKEEPEGDKYPENGEQEGMDSGSSRVNVDDGQDDVIDDRLSQQRGRGEARQRNQRQRKDMEATLRLIAENKRQNKNKNRDSSSEKRRSKYSNRGGRRHLLARRNRRRHMSNKRRRQQSARRRAEQAAKRQRNAAVLKNLGRLDACHFPFRHRVEGGQGSSPENGLDAPGGALETRKGGLGHDSWVRVIYDGHRLSVFTGRPVNRDPRAYFDEYGEDQYERAEGGEAAEGELVAWRMCFSMADVALPSRGYFGLSASTGDLHDAHEIISFSVRSFSKASVDSLLLEAPKEQEYDKSREEGERSRGNREDEGEESTKEKIQAARMEAAARAKQISDEKRKRKDQKVERRKQMKNGRKGGGWWGRPTHNDDDDDDDDDDDNHTKKRDDERQRGRRTSFSSRFFSMLSYVMRILSRVLLACLAAVALGVAGVFGLRIYRAHRRTPLLPLVGAKRAGVTTANGVFSLPGVPPSLNAKRFD